jgi:hypothetical protein
VPEGADGGYGRQHRDRGHAGGHRPPANRPAAAGVAGAMPARGLDVVRAVCTRSVRCDGGVAGMTGRGRVPRQGL